MSPDMPKAPETGGRSEIATMVIDGLRGLLDRSAEHDAAAPTEPLAEAVDLLGSMVDRLHRGASALRPTPLGPADMFSVVGSEIELVAQLSPVGRRLGRVVRFYGGDDVLGEVEV